MLYISDMLLQHKEVSTFEGFVIALKKRAKNERFLHMDLKPPFPDTPENWEIVLEAAFSGFDNHADD